MKSIVGSTVLPDQAGLRRMPGSAVQAPSVYNSQPWRWCAGTTAGVDLFADPDRHLIAIDADGRELLLSCGAALHHLIVALAGPGWSAQVERFPDPENSEHLAQRQQAGYAAELARWTGRYPGASDGITARLGALRAGEASSAVLLTATDMGLATTPLSQPLEVAHTRDSISEHIVGPQSFPQLLLRVGWPQPGCPQLPPTPRRGLDHVLVER
jgi:nitroreductase